VLTLSKYAARYLSDFSPLLLKVPALSRLFAVGFTLLLLTAHAYAAEVTLTWTDPHNDPVEVGGYTLYYWQDDWDIPAHIAVGKQTAYTLTDLEGGQIYYIAVTAHDGYGGRESEYSNVVHTNGIILPTGITLTVNRSTIVVGGTLKVSWTAPSGRPATDWIGFFLVGTPNTDVGWWRYTNGKASGSFKFPAPSPAGSYEFRYLLEDGVTDAARSKPVTVKARQ
jgi:hypothetical protein